MLARLLAAADVSRSAFYYQLKVLAQEDPRAGLKNKISAIYHAHKGRYGYRRITLALRQAGELVNHKAVQRLMVRMGLKSMVRPKKYQAYRGAEGTIAPNGMNREFQAGRPNEKWTTDVTEFKVAGKKLFLSPVMDLFNGEIVAFHMSLRPQFELVETMLKKAIAKLGPEDRPMLHSDQGWQYQTSGYRNELAANRITQSMSRKGNCLDNAAMESFFGTLKSEFFYLTKFRSVEQLQEELPGYIHYYNHDRIRQKLNGLSPVNYRTQAMCA